VPESTEPPSIDPSNATSLHDRPTAAELLQAVAATLDERVLPAVEGGVRHDVRVAANLCRTIAREVAGTNLDAAVTAEFQALVGDDSLVGVELLTAAGALIDRADLDAATEAAARSAALAHVEAKLAVSRPGYDAGDT